MNGLAKMPEDDRNPFRPPATVDQPRPKLVTNDGWRKSRDRWSQRSWLLGIALFLFGGAISYFATGIVSSFGIVLVFMSYVVVIFGPISWYWLSNKSDE